MVPPKPKLFRAIAILAMMIGSYGTFDSLANLVAEARPVPPSSAEDPRLLGFQPKTEADKDLARKVVRRMDRVQERHRAATIGLHAANAVLSVLLLGGALTLASRRSWAHWVMLQALAASALYELPAAVQKIRIYYDTLHAQHVLWPALLRDMGQPVPADSALMTGSAIIMAVVLTVGMAILRLAFYGTGVWYLRRPDVRAWFSSM